MRRFPLPLLLVSLLTLTLAAPAFAAQPVHDTFKIDETIEENLCGIDVTTHIVGNGNVLDFGDHLVDLTVIDLTFTNADGDWLSNHIAGPARIMEQLDGSILTITEVHRGVHSKIRSSEGLTAVFDRGQISFRTVIDLHDLEDEEDDELISAETLFQAGPHPEADSEFTLFCDVAQAVLG